MRISIREAAKLCGVSMRTLRYYDEIGLLKPSEVTMAGYRYYDDESLSTLQQILFFRELAFPLKEIAQLLTAPDYDKRRALQAHRELLLRKRRHLDEQLRLADETIGGIRMHPKTTLADIEAAKQAYAAEARALWGHTDAYRESDSRSRTAEEELSAAEEADNIFAAFADSRGQEPSSGPVQALVKRWQAHITRWYYPCEAAILAALGEMYVGDARFQANIDRFGDGTAQLMSEAIRFYCGADKA